jgi:hypothetical protein
MTVLAVSPSDGSVVLRLRGVSKDPAAEHQPATTESLSVDVTDKPLISLVWGGFYVLMAGAMLALVKRSREARKAVIAESEERSTAREHAPVRRGPVVPAHSRSRL